MMLYSQILFIKKGKVELMGVVNSRIKKCFSLFIAFMICITVFFSGLVYADDEEAPDADTAIAENYWAELEKSSYVDGGVYPKYLMKLQDSVLKNFDLARGGDSPSTGIYKNLNTLTYVAGMDMYEYISKPELQDNEGPNGDPNYQDNKYHNPFNFKFDSDFIKDRDQLNVYGDISVNNNTENAAIGTHAIGDKLNLDFSVNLGNLSKWQNTRLWGDINGHSKGTAWKTHGTEAYIATDSELVFIINIPRGITVPDVNDLKFRVDGLNSLKFKKAERDGDKLIIRVHPSLGESGYLPARDYYAYLKTISNVKISVEGLLVNSEATVNENITITGSVVGVQDELVTDSMEVAKKKIGAGSDDVRAAYFFAAKQSISERDAAAPQDKPNLISYTFKVNRAAENTTPSNPGKTVKVVKKTKTPKTGDDADIMLYVLLLGVSGAILTGVSYFRRRKVS